MPKVEIKNLPQAVGIGGVSLLLFMGDVPLPLRMHQLPTNTTYTRLLSSDEGLTLSGYYADDIQRAMKLRDFALKLLANTKDLDENVATALSANFWKLYEPI